MKRPSRSPDWPSTLAAHPWLGFVDDSTFAPNSLVLLGNRPRMATGATPKIRLSPSERVHMLIAFAALGSSFLIHFGRECRPLYHPLRLFPCNIPVSPHKRIIISMADARRSSRKRTMEDVRFDGGKEGLLAQRSTRHDQNWRALVQHSPSTVSHAQRPQHLSALGLAS